MKCSYCGKDLDEEGMPFKCKFCSEYFCAEHRLPENHDCPGLDEYKKKRSKGKDMTYEPFKKKNLNSQKKEQQEFLSNVSNILNQFESMQQGGEFYKYLIGISLVAFILQGIVPNFTEFFQFNPLFSNIFSRPWMFVSSIFLHGNFWHLLVNMIVLFFFGKELERRVGSKNFLIIFFASGIIANFGYMGASYLTGFLTTIESYRVFVPALGASGAIFGVFASIAVLSPNIRVLVFFIFPMKIIHALILFAVYDIYQLFIRFSGASTAVASSAHLTGLFVGLLFGYYFRNRVNDRVRNFGIRF
ncbi:MAG: rhomboid family intramembrane serine protease [Candidatus Aenigmatarchaeota archaeon]